MSNGNQPTVGRTFWDFASEGAGRRATWVAVVACGIGLTAFFVLAGMGYRVFWQGQPLLQFERTSPYALQVHRQKSTQGSTFTAPGDGFVYVQCGNNHEGEVLLQSDPTMTTGLVKERQSGMFPIFKDQLALVTVARVSDPAKPSNPDDQVIVYFFGLR